MYLTGENYIGVLDSVLDDYGVERNLKCSLYHFNSASQIHPDIIRNELVDDKKHFLNSVSSIFLDQPGWGYDNHSGNILVTITPNDNFGTTGSGLALTGYITYLNDNIQYQLTNTYDSTAFFDVDLTGQNSFILNSGLTTFTANGCSYYSGSLLYISGSGLSSEFWYPSLIIPSGQSSWPNQVTMELTVEQTSGTGAWAYLALIPTGNHPTMPLTTTIHKHPIDISITGIKTISFFKDGYTCGIYSKCSSGFFTYSNLKFYSGYFDVFSGDLNTASGTCGHISPFLDGDSFSFYNRDDFFEEYTNPNTTGYVTESTMISYNTPTGRHLIQIYPYRLIDSKHQILFEYEFEYNLTNTGKYITFNFLNFPSDINGVLYNRFYEDSGMLACNVRHNNEFLPGFFVTESSGPYAPALGPFRSRDLHSGKLFDYPSTGCHQEIPEIFTKLNSGEQTKHSVAMWFKAEDFIPKTLGSIDGIRFDHYSSLTASFEGEEKYTIDSQQILNTGEWILLALTYDGFNGNASLYVNQQKNTIDITGNLTIGNTVISPSGGNFTSQYLFDKISSWDEISLHEDDVIIEIYNSGVPKDYPYTVFDIGITGVTLINSGSGFWNDPLVTVSPPSGDGQAPVAYPILLSDTGVLVAEANQAFIVSSGDPVVGSVSSSLRDNFFRVGYEPNLSEMTIFFNCRPSDETTVNLFYENEIPFNSTYTGSGFYYIPLSGLNSGESYYYTKGNSTALSLTTTGNVILSNNGSFTASGNYYLIGASGSGITAKIEFYPQTSIKSSRILAASMDDINQTSGFILGLNPADKMFFEYIDGTTARIRTLDNVTATDNIFSVSISQQYGRLTLGVYDVLKEELLYQEFGIPNYKYSNSTYLYGFPNETQYSEYIDFTGIVYDTLIISGALTPNQMKAISSSMLASGYNPSYESGISIYYPVATGIDYENTLLSYSTDDIAQISILKENGSGIPILILSSTTEYYSGTGLNIQYSYGSGVRTEYITIDSSFDYNWTGILDYCWNKLAFVNYPLASSEHAEVFIYSGDNNNLNVEPIPLNLYTYYFPSGLEAGYNVNVYNNGIWQISGVDYQIASNKIDSSISGKYRPEIDTITYDLISGAGSRSYLLSSGYSGVWNLSTFIGDISGYEHVYANGQKLILDVDYQIVSNEVILTGNDWGSGYYSITSHQPQDGYLLISSTNTGLADLSAFGNFEEEMVWVNGQKLMERYDYVRLGKEKLINSIIDRTSQTNNVYNQDFFDITIMSYPPIIV